MRLGHAIAVFAHAAQLGLKHTLSERLLLLGSFLTYATIVLAYSAVFRAVGSASVAAHGLTQANLIWYMGLTEFVVFCTSTFQYREFAHEIQSGEIDLLLVRPCPVWIVKLGDGSGRFLARLLVLAVPCLALTGVVAGQAFPGAASLLAALLSALLASPLLTASFFMAGASCLWVRQAEPVFWIWQKSLFLLGGLLWPLSIYPPAVRLLAWLSPFPAMMATPAQWGLPGGGWWLAAALLHQIFWAAAIVLAMAKVDRAVLRAIQEGETA
jgi:ABC-2 type transport system permease protein